MKTSYLVFAALGAAAVLLLTSDKAKEVKKVIADNADAWKEKLSSFASDTGSELTSFKKVLNKEVKGLSKDARERILAIVEESVSGAGNIKKSAAKQLS